MVRIQIDNDVYTIPEKWEELTKKELLYLAKITKEDIPTEQVKLYMLLYHLKAHVARHADLECERYKIVVGKSPETVRFRIRNKRYKLSPGEVLQLSNLYSFLFTRVETCGKANYYIYPRIEGNNPYSSFNILHKLFKGPSEFLFSCTFEQFMFVQTYLDQMKDDPSYINHVIACLWHRGKNWDAHNIERDAKWLKWLPDTTKMVIYWFISSCFSSWANEYPRIFSGQGGEVRHGVFDNQQRLLNTLANGDITKKNEVRNSNIIDAFYVIDEALRQAEEKAKAYKK